MRIEAAQAPAAAARQLAAQADRFAALGADLRQSPPLSLLTVARGSSDHAAHYMAYLIMARLGRLVSSLPMSVVTLYRSRLVCDGLVALAFSQSGQSPDLVASMTDIGARGARTLAFVNDEYSPLALGCTVKNRDAAAGMTGVPVLISLPVVFFTTTGRSTFKVRQTSRPACCTNPWLNKVSGAVAFAARP